MYLPKIYFHPQNFCAVANICQISHSPPPMNIFKIYLYYPAICQITKHKYYIKTRPTHKRQMTLKHQRFKPTKSINSTKLHICFTFYCKIRLNKECEFFSLYLGMQISNISYLKGIKQQQCPKIVFLKIFNNYSPKWR